MNRTSLLSRGAAVAALTLSLTVAGIGAPVLAGASAASTPDRPAAPSARRCQPSGAALGFSDSLDKLLVGGVTVGGLSSLSYDRRRHAWASTVDNHGTDPSRIWFFRDLAHPRVVGAPLVLRRADGTAYDGTTADNEGLAVLPDGRFLVSSESEPSIRIYGRDGIEQVSLPVPGRFAVTGTTAEGQATANATLEGLTISPDGRWVVASMEGALSGDVSGTGDATLHRFLVYGYGRGRWTLQRQIAYRAEPGNRIPEIAAVDGQNLIVEEGAFDPATGNTVQLFAVHGYAAAPDVSAVADLAVAPGAVVVRKRLLADLVDCPTLGAPSKETQANPLLDNYEGMAVTGVVGRRHGPAVVGVSLISDDNFSPTQTTRLLNLVVATPRPPA